MTIIPQPDKRALARQLASLTTERTALFARAGRDAGLTKVEHSRLAAVEREIDECYILIRQQRAERDARRFTNEGLILRRGINPRPASPTQ